MCRFCFVLSCRFAQVHDTMIPSHHDTIVINNLGALHTSSLRSMASYLCCRCFVDWHRCDCPTIWGHAWSQWHYQTVHKVCQCFTEQALYNPANTPNVSKVDSMLLEACGHLAYIVTEPKIELCSWPWSSRKSKICTQHVNAAATCSMLHTKRHHGGSNMHLMMIQWGAVRKAGCLQILL